MTGMDEREPPLAAMLPNTRYFEMASERVGARFGVWVTVPPGYSRAADTAYPVLYQPDGNFGAPLTAPILPIVNYDPIHPTKPFVQVCVGYIGVDAERMLAVRARDLLPPGEPLPDGLEAGIDHIVASGMLDREGGDLYLKYLHDPAADKFLAFLEEELHPAVTASFNVVSDSASMFGYSYGGLFATYVAMRRSVLFKQIGAGSPGILPRASRIFSMYEENLAGETDHSGRLLHMTVCGPEITAPSLYQSLVGAGAAEFMVLAGQRPLKGLDFSSRIVEHESHATGFVPSYSSFLRTVYSAR